MSEEPEIAGREPIPVEVEEGRTYWWCACGRSKNQPFCDGSHKGTAFNPVSWECRKTGKAFFCACKRTGRSPMCDGTHNRQ